MIDIDWANVMATLASAAMGGWIAAKVAQRQSEAAIRAEQEKVRKEVARDLIEAMDSFLHIAYRGEDPNSRLERQRLRRRIQSLAALSVPERFADIQGHLDIVDGWWRSREGGPRVRGAGVSATEHFFDQIKGALLTEVFRVNVQLSQPDGSSGPSGSGLPT